MYSVSIEPNHKTTSKKAGIRKRRSAHIFTSRPKNLAGQHPLHMSDGAEVPDIQKKKRHF